MIHIFLILLLILTTPYTLYTSCNTLQLPLHIQLEQAEAKLAKAKNKQARGPETNHKALVMPVLGMSAGLITICCSGTLLVNPHNRSLSGSALLTGIIVFGLSYLKFNKSSSNESDYLAQDVHAKDERVKWLRQQIKTGNN